MENNKPIAYTSPAETDDMTRKVLIWLSAYEDLPVYVIKPEPMLEPGQEGMELTVIQSSITRRYITGGHMAEYQFGVFYRVQPSSIDERLKAIQSLNALGDYSVTTTPDLGDGIQFNKCEVTTQAQLYAPYENGDEDYQILMKLTYEVI